MGRITIELMRKRSEHNEGEIRTMKELSLHQEKLEKIENIDRWCRGLEILLLHNNNISKIENVSRLKCLKYLNLTLNNIEVIEGLQGCESLEKLDLTLNFIGQITSVKTLEHNIHLENLYLTGNPCCEFPGYKDYVIANVPQLVQLDGEDITKTAKLLAKQNIKNIEEDIMKCQNKYLEKREFERRICNDIDIEDPDFWSQTHPNTPEVRAMMQKRLELDEDEKSGNNKKKNETNQVKSRRFFKADGSPLNINDGKYPIQISDDPKEGFITANIGIPKYLDTSLLSVDIEPTFVRVVVKQKIVQIHLSDEVKPDSTTIQRSTTTGALMIKMPLLDQSSVIKFQNEVQTKLVNEKKKDVVAKELPIPPLQVHTENQSSSPANFIEEVGNKKNVTRDTKSLMFNDDKNIISSVNEDEVPPLE